MDDEQGISSGYVTSYSTRVALRPLLPSDFNFVYELAVSLDAGRTWKFRGTTPSPDVVMRQLYDGVVLQQLIVMRLSGEPVGISGIYNAHPASGFGYLHTLGRTDPPMRGLVTEGTALLIDHAFDVLGLRKLYIEILSSNEARVGVGLARYCELEGRLLSHELQGEVYADLLTYALYRPRWREVRRRFLHVAGEQ
jgi:RimJ/RimL family protein N-acetyltransferase